MESLVQVYVLRDSRSSLVIIVGTLLPLQAPFYFCPPASVNSTRRGRAVLAELVYYELLLETRIWPHLFASWVIQG
jgi:hypothetical protein